MSSKISTPLSDDELEELDRFLLSENTSDETMLLDMLDGYLTAIVIGLTSCCNRLEQPTTFKICGDPLLGAHLYNSCF